MKATIHRFCWAVNVLVCVVYNEALKSSLQDVFKWDVKFVEDNSRLYHHVPLKKTKKHFCALLKPTYVNQLYPNYLQLL